MVGVVFKPEGIVRDDGKICTIHRTLAIRHSGPDGSVFPQSAIDFQKYNCHAPRRSVFRRPTPSQTRRRHHLAADAGVWSLSAAIPATQSSGKRPMAAGFRG
jgi:hypothetical protein